MIVQTSAAISSHTHRRPFAIGGQLFDATPTQSASVGGHSLVGSLTAGTERMFNFQVGITVGQPMPFDWSLFEYLARTIEAIDNGLTHRIYVRCGGGRVTITSLHELGTTFQGSGRNTLVVFNTADRVIIGADPSDGRPFSASILAPFSHVEIEADVGYVDGFIIAKSLTMDSRAGSVQLHGECFDGLTSQGCARADTCASPGGSGRPACVDVLSMRRCIKKRRKGKCQRKRRVREVKCRQTCGGCSQG